MLNIISASNEKNKQMYRFVIFNHINSADRDAVIGPVYVFLVKCETYCSCEMYELGSSLKQNGFKIEVLER